MPTDTFFHLPKEKQDRIIAAARKEFSRVSLSEASIANIVKEAGISRGSFYQYFENKEDVYFYCFHLMHQMGFEELFKILNQVQGDLFQGFRQFFARALPMIFSSEHAQFFKNSFMNMDYRASREMAKKFMKQHPHLEPNEKKHLRHPHPEHSRALLELIDRKKLQVSDDHELMMLIQMMMNAVFSTIIEGFRQQKISENKEDEAPLDIDQLLQQLYCKFDWLEHGASRKDEIND